MITVDLEKFKKFKKEHYFTATYLLTKEKNKIKQDLALSNDQANKIKIDNIHTISILVKYDKTDKEQRDVICMIFNHVSKKDYAIHFHPENMPELLDILNWNDALSQKDTEKMFKQLMFSSNKERISNGIHLTHTALNIHNINDQSYFSVSGTAIDKARKFKTIEKAAAAIDQNYTKNVVGQKDNTISVED